jgi:isopentenyl-diphosphate delta-isomerase
MILITQVDSNDNILGSIEKLQAHELGVLHRAFSILLFKKEESKLYLLMQKRHASKYHSKNLWTNTCCSHPNFNEDIDSAVTRRLKEEMGIEAKVNYIGKFHYKVQIEHLIENEIDYVYVGYINFDINNINYNKSEISEIKYMEVNDLLVDINASPNNYTKWLKEALMLALNGIDKCH